MHMVNYIAIIVAALAQFVLGFLWYSPVLFGNKWMKLNGFKKSSFSKSDMNQGMVISLITALVMAYVLAQLMLSIGVATVGGALIFGFWMWLGFIFTTQVGSIFYEKYKPGLVCIHGTYWLASIWVMTLVLALWK